MPTRNAAAKALGVRTSLIDAVSLVHRFDWHCIELGLYKPNGALNMGALSRDAGPDHPIVRFLEHGEAPVAAGAVMPAGGFRRSAIYPGVRGFHFPGMPPSLDELLECTRYHLGYKAARAAFASDPELQPGHVLALLAEDCLMAPPIEGSAEAAQLHKRSVAQQRFAVLGNGSFCYVAWGVLQLDEFWEHEDEGAREIFIQEVLSLGTQSDALTWMCLRVLNPPLIPTDQQPARGVARPFDPHRGVIGFTDGHQSFVQGVRRELASHWAADPPVRAAECRRASLPRLGAWSSVMLDRILRERGTLESADAALRNGSMDERILYWRALARSASFEVFNAAYLDELTRMTSGTDEVPGAARMKELEAIALERPLLAAEQAELSTLKDRAKSLRVALIGELGNLLVMSGGPLHVAAVAATLAGPTEAILAEGCGIVPGGPMRATVLGNAWIRLALVPSDQSVWVVGDHLGGAMVLPEYALDSMVGLLGVHRPPGYDGILDEVLQSDSVGMQSRAIMNPNWMDEERFRTEFTRLLDTVRSGAVAAGEREEIRLRLAGALARRSDGAGRDLLLRTFEDGLWKPGAAGWGHRLSKGPWAAQLWAKLKPGDRADLIQRGLAPRDLFD